MSASCQFSFVGLLPGRSDVTLVTNNYKLASINNMGKIKTRMKSLLHHILQNKSKISNRFHFAVVLAILSFTLHFAGKINKILWVFFAVFIVYLNFLKFFQIVCLLKVLLQDKKNVHLL